MRHKIMATVEKGWKGMLPWLRLRQWSPLRKNIQIRRLLKGVSKLTLAARRVDTEVN
jgi:hypothetical protein